MENLQQLPKSTKDRIKGEIYLYENDARRWSGKKLEKICQVCHKKRPSFCLENETLATHCSECKSVNMIDINHNKFLCIICKKKQPSFGLDGKKTHCKDCKKNGMTNNKYKGNKLCVCNSVQPVFNYPDQTEPKYCSKCKLDGMIDIKNKKCVECNITRANSKNPLYRNHCVYCFVNKFPDEKVSRNFKVKERYVKDFLEKEFPNIDITYDKIITNGCSSRRPDFMIDLGYQVLIVEVDENQHSNYNCENKRLMEISKDINHRPLYVIRFNPDKYDKFNKDVFAIHKQTGLLILKETNEFNSRLKKLKNDIQTNFLNTRKEKLLEIKNLFYDCF